MPQPFQQQESYCCRNAFAASIENPPPVRRRRSKCLRSGSWALDVEDTSNKPGASFHSPLAEKHASCRCHGIANWHQEASPPCWRLAFVPPNARGAALAPAEPGTKESDDGNEFTRVLTRRVVRIGSVDRSGPRVVVDRIGASARRETARTLGHRTGPLEL